MRLVKAEIAAARKTYCGKEAPTLVADGAARDTFLAETGNLRPQVVAHEIELMFAVALGGMAGEFRGRRGKDQPSTAGINGRKAKHVPEKGPVGLPIPCGDDGMHACNHGHLYRCEATVLCLVGRFLALEPALWRLLARADEVIECRKFHPVGISRRIG